MQIIIILMIIIITITNIFYNVTIR